MLTIDGQFLEEIRVTRVRDVLTELDVSVLEGKQLRVLVSSIGQGTNAAGAIMIIPGDGWGRGEGRRVKRPDNRVEQKRLGEHVVT